ncbi:MAG: hypothetical protein V4739_11635 [Pseudomonadota bacterium]
MTEMHTDIAHWAARLVVEEGLEYRAAKQRAAKELGQGRARGTPLPSNEAVEDAVREHIALFHADTQPHELTALRATAVQWMRRLAVLRPHLTGAVWRGTATRLSDIHLELYCDDAKQAELLLLNEGLSFDTQSQTRPGQPALDVLSLSTPCTGLGETVGVHLWVLDHDDLRGALKPDARGRTHRGDLAALNALLARENAVDVSGRVGP